MGEAPVCASLFPLIVQRCLFLLSALWWSLFPLSELHIYGKSKKKSSLLQFAQQDYKLHSSRPSSTSRAPRSLSRNRSFVLQDPLVPSRASTPSRTKMVFADVVGSPYGVRVCSKGKKRTCGVNHTLHHHPPLLPLVDEMMALLAVLGFNILQMTIMLNRLYCWEIPRVFNLD